MNINIKIRDAEFFNGDFLPKRKIIEIPISEEMQQECYQHNAMDAPSELKKNLLQEINEKLDEIIINDCPYRTNETWLSNKLNRIKVIDKEDL